MALRWWVLLALGACLSKPNKITPSGDGGNGGGDGGHRFDDAPADTIPPGFAARLISVGYYNEVGGAILNQTAAGFTLPTKVSAGAMSDVVDGDLVLIFGNIDNTPTINLPTPGFAPLVQHEFGADGQVYYGYWKIAGATEPDHYTEMYTNAGGSSKASAVAMIAIHGAATTQPMFHNDNDTTCLVNNGTCGFLPVVATSSGVTTTAANSIVVYVAGSDWLAPTDTIAFTMPGGWMSLAAFADKGSNDFWWTSIMLGWTYAPNAGATGPITGMLSSANKGLPWTIAVAVAPE
jgi:hypothetical protein